MPLPCNYASKRQEHPQDWPNREPWRTLVHLSFRIPNLMGRTPSQFGRTQGHCGNPQPKRLHQS